MDLLRSTIKVLFYDFAPEWIAESFKLDFLEQDKHFYDRMIECMKWREQKFTGSELDILQLWMRDELMNDDEVGMSINEESVYTSYERVFVPLSKCGEELLDLSAKTPQVKYRHLLRWRDLTLLIGEELLTLASLARHDVMTGIDRYLFPWSNVLPHNDLKLNGIFSQTLSDTHAHLNASTDVFDFNWTVAMNHPQILSLLREEKYKRRFTGHGPHQEYDTVSRHSDLKFSLLEWIEVAAALRMRILMLIIGIYQNDFQCPLLDFDDVGLLESLLDEFSGNYSFVSDHIVPTQNGVKFDYAIIDWNECGLRYPDNEDDIKSPFMILHGERSLIYNFFKFYFNGVEEVRRFAPQLYLYLVIKNKIRRELTQTNPLIGFGNFKKYQDLKFMFVDLLSNKDINLKKRYQEIATAYAIQSAVVSTSPNFFEARVMPNEVGKLRHFNYKKAIFGEGNTFDYGKEPLVSLVAHFSKATPPIDKPEGEIRYKKLRDNLEKSTKKLITSVS